MQGVSDLLFSSNLWAVIAGIVSLVSLVAIPATMWIQHKQNYKSFNSQEFKNMEVALHTLFEYALSFTNLPENERNGRQGIDYQNEMNKSTRQVIVLLRVVSEREKNKAIASKLKEYLELFVAEIDEQTFFNNRQKLLEQFADLRKKIR